MSIISTSSKINPHKIGLCFLLQGFVNPSCISDVKDFGSIQQNLAIFLLRESMETDVSIEPSFSELKQKILSSFESNAKFIIHHLSSQLDALFSPDDLITLFSNLKDLLSVGQNNASKHSGGKGREGEGGDGDFLSPSPLLIHPNSVLGLFLRKCILAINSLSFEGLCNLFIEMKTYCMEKSFSHDHDTLVSSPSISSSSFSSSFSSSSSSSSSSFSSSSSSSSSSSPPSSFNAFSFPSSSTKLHSHDLNRFEKDEFENPILNTQAFASKKCALEDELFDPHSFKKGENMKDDANLIFEISKMHSNHFQNYENGSPIQGLFHYNHSPRALEHERKKGKEAKKGKGVEKGKGKGRRKGKGKDTWNENKDGDESAERKKDERLERKKKEKSMKKSAIRERKGYEERINVVGKDRVAEKDKIMEEEEDKKGNDAGFSLAFGNCIPFPNGENFNHPHPHSHPPPPPHLSNFHADKTHANSKNQMQNSEGRNESLVERIHEKNSSDLENEIIKLSNRSHDIPKVHYLKYLKFFKQKNYPQAIYYLHKYFDHSVGKSNISIEKNNFDNFFFGIFSLSSLHTFFHHIEKALQAVDSAIQFSHQLHDEIYLTHALAGLCHIFFEFYNSKKIEKKIYKMNSSYSLLYKNNILKNELYILLEKCLNQSIHLNLFHLIAFSRLLLAKFYLLNLRRIKSVFGSKSSMELSNFPKQIYQSFQMSSFLLNEGSAALFSASQLITNGLPNFGGSTHHSSNFAPNNSDVPLLPHHFSSAHFSHSLNNLSSNFFSSLSESASRSHSNLNLNLNSNLNFASNMFFSGSKKRFSDSLIQLSGSANSLKSIAWKLFGSNFLFKMYSNLHIVCYTNFANNDELLLSHINLIQHEYDTYGFDDAFKIIETFSTKNIFSYNQNFQILKLQILFQRSLNRGEIKNAKKFLFQFHSLINENEFEFKFEFKFKLIQTYILTSQFDKAIEEATKLFTFCCVNGTQIFKIQILLIFAQIYLESSSPSCALPYAQECIRLCKCFNADIMQFEAIVLLCEICLQLNSQNAAQKCGQILCACFPFALQTCDLKCKSKAYLVLAKSFTFSLNSSSETDATAILSYLNTAIQGFEKLQDRKLLSEAFFLEAQVWDSLKKFENRERSAMKCLNVMNEHAKAMME